MAFYGEDATLFGIFLDRQSNEVGRPYYLPAIPIQIHPSVISRRHRANPAASADDSAAALNAS